MGAVKNHFHDEICAQADADRDGPDEPCEAPYIHRLGDILGMALRGEITPHEAQDMANARQNMLERLGA